MRFSYSVYCIGRQISRLTVALLSGRSSILTASYTIASAVNLEGESMGNLSSALQQLRMERKQAQARVENLDQAISVIESLNGSGAVRPGKPTDANYIGSFTAQNGAGTKS
jgi:hypothetical protein